MARGVEMRVDYLPTGEYITEEFYYPRDYLSWSADQQAGWQQDVLQAFSNKHLKLSARVLDHYDDWD